MSARGGEASGTPGPPAHLEIRALAVRYGAIHAVHDVSLEVRPKEIVTLGRGASRRVAPARRTPR